MKIRPVALSDPANDVYVGLGLALRECRFKDSILERFVDAMSTVAAYIDMNAWRAKMCTDPGEYKWCSWGATLAGKKEVVFTSGAIIGCWSYET